jgi:hypothetical protein
MRRSLARPAGPDAEDGFGRHGVRSWLSSTSVERSSRFDPGRPSREPSHEPSQRARAVPRRHRSRAEPPHRDRPHAGPTGTQPRRPGRGARRRGVRRRARRHRGLRGLWLLSWLQRDGQSLGRGVPQRQTPYLMQRAATEVGILATRGPRRPSPVGIHLVRLLGRRLRHPLRAERSGAPVRLVRRRPARAGRHPGDTPAYGRTMSPADRARGRTSMSIRARRPGGDGRPESIANGNR